MSADNGVYVLRTIRTRRQVGHSWVRSEPHYIWRVAVTSAIDNYDWYKANEPHNLGAYLKDVWDSSLVFETKQQAMLVAHELAETNRTEYGVCFINTDLKFYKDL